MNLIRTKMLGVGAVLSQSLVHPQAASETTDQNLLRDIAAGDEAALGVAYRAHRQHVWAFARRLVGEDAAADDLVHEVFVRLPRAIRKFRAEASLRTFLVSMAVNHARNHVRAAARRRAAGRRLAHESQAPASYTDPVETQQLVQALTLALDALPLDQRVAFVLCHVEERSAAEAAELAGTNENNMRARVFHARKRLQAALSHWRPETAKRAHEGGAR